MVSRLVRGELAPPYVDSPSDSYIWSMDNATALEGGLFVLTDMLMRRFYSRWLIVLIATPLALIVWNDYTVYRISKTEINCGYTLAIAIGYQVLNLWWCYKFAPLILRAWQRSRP